MFNQRLSRRAWLGTVPGGIGLAAATSRMVRGDCVNLEYEIHADDPLPGMQKSFSHMRGVLAGIQGAKYSA